jgi:hypothetical protein
MIVIALLTTVLLSLILTLCLTTNDTALVHRSTTIHLLISADPSVSRLLQVKELPIRRIKD